MNWTAEFRPIRMLKVEELAMTLPIHFKMEKGVCYFCGCGQPKVDECYNCEKHICNRHAMPFVFLLHPATHEPIFVLNVCPECVKDNHLSSLG